MKREQIIQILGEQAAVNLAVANEHRRVADRLRAQNNRASNALAELETEREGVWRFSVGCGLAAINHLNGVSPE